MQTSTVLNSQPLETFLNVLNTCSPVQCRGMVTKVSELMVESRGPSVSVGDICWINSRKNDKKKIAQVVGIKEENIILMPFEDTNGIGIGCQVESSSQALTIGVGKDLLGRVIDGFGNPIDGKGPINTPGKVEIYRDPPNPLSRQRITSPIQTGVRAIDSLISCGEGQRMGIFAGSGVGKSVLLGMIARNSSADINVIALIGERGREVKEFIERDLGEEGLRRSVVVVVTFRSGSGIKDTGCPGSHNNFGIFQRPGKSCYFNDGFRNTGGHGTKRNRPGYWRAAYDKRLYAIYVCYSSKTVGTVRNV